MTAKKRSAAEAMMEDDDPITPETGALPPSRVNYAAGSRIQQRRPQFLNMRIAQGLSKEVQDRKAQIGQILVENHPPSESLTLVPLQIGYNREFRPEKNGPVTCAAPDGEFGHGVPGGPCDQCPLSKWSGKDPITGKNRPPLCQEGYPVRFYDVTHKAIVEFRFAGYGLRTGEFLATQELMYGAGNLYAINFTTKSTKNDKGSFFIPDIQILSDIPEGHAEVAHRFYDVLTQEVPQSTRVVPLAAPDAEPQEVVLESGEYPF